MADGTRLPMSLSSFSGSRDGYRALGEMVFSEKDSPDRLVIRFVLEPGVPTRFVSGDYAWRGQAGPATCLSIDFFGGQGGLPSVGGTFEVKTPDGRAYQIFLPTTEMPVKRP